MQLRFFGATGGTTGTCHMLSFAGRSVLFDCGLYQGRREESHERNARFAFDPRQVDAVLQSHAHVDHSGKLPMLVRHGYRGPIHATPATRDLCEVLLYDCAHILEQDAAYLNRRRAEAGQAGRNGGPARPDPATREGLEFDEELLPKDEVQPLYVRADVDATLPRFRGHVYGEWFDVFPGLRARFHEAGHILGSAWVEAEAREEGRLVRVVFTGDYGRRNQPILRDPEPLVPCDVLITESTYGNRSHPTLEQGKEGLAEAVSRLVQRGRGRLLIPAFAVGRTQNVLYELARLVHEDRVPPVDIVVDSPLATAATRVLIEHPELFDEEAQAEYRRYRESEDFRARLRFTESVEDSKALNRDPRPCIVIAASGMCETGRIVHHLAWHVDSPDTEILIVGFQAAHTLGRRLLEGRNPVRILGRMHAVRARITPMLGFSAHADREGLLEALTPLADAQPHVFLVHGEDSARRPFEVELRRRGFSYVDAPNDAQVWRI